LQRSGGDYALDRFPLVLQKRQSAKPCINPHLQQRENFNLFLRCSSYNLSPKPNIRFVRNDLFGKMLIYGFSKLFIGNYTRNFFCKFTSFENKSNRNAIDAKEPKFSSYFRIFIYIDSN